MEVYANVGLYNWEKVISRLIVLNVEIISNTGDAKVSKLNSQVNFADKSSQKMHDVNTSVHLAHNIVNVNVLKKLIITHCANTRFDYLENLVSSLRMHLMKELDIIQCKVKAQKIPFLMNSCYSCEE